MCFSTDVLKFAPWSYAMANQALTCPFAFHQRYVTKVEEQEPSRIESQVGTAVHTILDLCIKGMTVEQAYAQVVNTQNMTYDVEMSTYSYRMAIEDFMEGLKKFKDKAKVTEIHSEKKLGITKEFITTDYYNKNKDCVLRGSTDLILFTASKRVIIIDHKSGIKRQFSTYNTQLAIYNILVDSFIKDICTIRTAIHFVGSNKSKKGTRTIWGPAYPIEMVQTYFRKQIIAWLNEAAEHAKITEAKKSWLCKFCGYLYLCPLQK